ncbi:MAG: 4Fe-4S dicluster domain-containing protein [bacterium]|jgi:heterodisulfide reductase subunit C|nr:4Fe-4S dicluster domain-containing protein [candidate division KSB1 bacterium]MDH7558612.1 4Fe-4S dicluster domain-containing protein [bacterium]
MAAHQVTADVEAVRGRLSPERVAQRGGLSLTGRAVNSEFVARVRSLSGVDPRECYQCGKCSSGCPVTPEMDLIPSQVIRLLQLGQEQEVLGCKTIWLCASCFQCYSRCPKGIDFSRLAEALRMLAMAAKVEYLAPEDLPKEVLAEAPQQALVSAFRKYGL